MFLSLYKWELWAEPLSLVGSPVCSESKRKNRIEKNRMCVCVCVLVFERERENTFLVCGLYKYNWYGWGLGRIWSIYVSAIETIQTTSTFFLHLRFLHFPYAVVPVLPSFHLQFVTQSLWRLFPCSPDVWSTWIILQWNKILSLFLKKYGDFFQIHLWKKFNQIYWVV